ncbi:unnamed protein product [Adineta ricciae]|uniref:Uncharacterized protein n=2 Tax=Adineta ricciae TaxID=249248 RepID=A0A813Y7N0_ADIRI|nr:unnamed protein product [Adineta ricciae]
MHYICCVAFSVHSISLSVSSNQTKYSIIFRNLQDMENGNVAVEHQEQLCEEAKNTIDQETDDILKKTKAANNEAEEEDDDDDDEVVPSTTPKPAGEQDDSTEIEVNVSQSVSPGQVDVPGKEVNGSEKQEDNETVVSSSESVTNKKRELEDEDEDDQASSSNEQTKKMKIHELNDTPPVETKELSATVDV